MKKFATIKKAAEKRKGGEKELKKLLPKVMSVRKLAALGDDRFLAMMAKCINQAGFNWTVIENKWPQFEEAFYQFDPDKLAFLPPEQWEAYMQDTRVVRHWQKLSAVRENVEFVRKISATHDGFGKFLAGWPASDQVGLMQYLKKNGARLGGQTGQWFLRFIGKDSFILTQDVVTALQNAGVDVKDQPTSQTELKRIQTALNQWHDESGLPYTHISKIASYSTGTNYEAEHIVQQMSRMTAGH